MTPDTESVLEVIRGLPEFRRKHLILRVESVGSDTSEWHYRASYPELQDFAVNGPDVLEVILELEMKLDDYVEGKVA
jgi:hypothetical protein